MEKKTIVSSIGLALVGIASFLPMAVGDFTVGPFGTEGMMMGVLDIILTVIAALAVIFVAVAAFVPDVAKAVPAGLMKVIKVVGIWMIIPTTLSQIMAVFVPAYGSGFAMQGWFKLIGTLLFVVCLFLDKIVDFFKAIGAAVKALVARF
ncbi:hypothetical protein [Treponema sp.]|uniref:hypothetical protein n=1 Tax=Treponema sp. TaxID=166 RepID=UPI00298E52B3|nr:hypothetical protein [Treponema sp.]